MKNKCAKFPAFILVLSVVFFRTAEPTYSAPKEWRLEQSRENQTYVIYLTPKAVRIDSVDCGYSIICKAPTWTVHCFRNDDKAEWVGTVDTFSGALMQNPMAVPGNAKPPPTFTADGPFKLGEYKCTKYRTKHGYYICADEMPVDPMIVRLFNRMHGNPILPSIPLMMCINRRGGKISPSPEKRINLLDTNPLQDLREGKIITLQTSKIARRPFSEKDFALPQNYKMKRGLVEITYSSKQKGEIDDILGDVGFQGRVGRKDNRASTKKP